MREIKFRAWSIIGRRMYNWEQMHAYPAHKLSQYFRYHDMYEIMQYTGLKDKNGKEIYEGDILLYPNNEKVAVIWMGYPASFSPSEETNTTEVIGNIYENPLEGK